MKKKMLISTSGGLTSAYMAWWMKENKSDEFDFTFVFANTGQEHEETLIFLDKCDKFFNLDLVWLEANVDPRDNKGTTYNIVDFKTASRDGKPFEDVIKKYGIPNMDYKHCNRELKIQPIESYMADNNIFSRAIGIREDEFSRATPDKLMNKFKGDVMAIMEYRYFREGIYYPLIMDRSTTKEEIRHWWSKMPFTLEIEEHYGNCVGCWKKSDRKIWTIAKENPYFLDFFNRMEEKYSTFIPNGQEKGRDDVNVFYRGYRSTKDMIEYANNNEFSLFKPNKNNQLTLFNDEIDQDFSCNECGTIF